MRKPLRDKLVSEVCHERSATLHCVSMNSCHTNCESQSKSDSKLLQTPNIELSAISYFQERLEKVFIPISILMINQLKDQWSINLGLTLDEKLSLTNCTNNKINKTLKGVDVLRKLSMLLPRQSLLTIYKSFARPLLDYGDVI